MLQGGALRVLDSGGLPGPEFGLLTPPLWLHPSPCVAETDRRADRSGGMTPMCLRCAYIISQSHVTVPLAVNHGPQTSVAAAAVTDFYSCLTHPSLVP